MRLSQQARTQHQQHHDRGEQQQKRWLLSDNEDSISDAQRSTSADISPLQPEEFDLMPLFVPDNLFNPPVNKPVASGYITPDSRSIHEAPDLIRRSTSSLDIKTLLSPGFEKCQCEPRTSILLQEASPQQITYARDGDDHDPDWQSSREESLQNLPRGRPASPIGLPTSRPASTTFEEARRNLDRLRFEIQELEGSSETASATSQSYSESSSDGHQWSQVQGGNNTYTSKGEVQDRTTGHQGDRHDYRPNLVGLQKSDCLRFSDDPQSHERPRSEDKDDGHTRAEVKLDPKRTKLPSWRFICCFQKGPSRKCSGTGETISEVIKKLSDQHDIHVCDRCWSLKNTSAEADTVH